MKSNLHEIYGVGAVRRVRGALDERPNLSRRVEPINKSESSWTASSLKTFRLRYRREGHLVIFQRLFFRPVLVRARNMGKYVTLRCCHGSRVSIILTFSEISSNSHKTSSNEFFTLCRSAGSMLRTGAIQNAQRHLETLAGPSFQRYFATRPRRDESRSSRGPGGSEKSSAPRYNRTYSAKDNKESPHRRPRDVDRSNSRFPPRNADASRPSYGDTPSWGSGRRGRDSEESSSRNHRRPSSDGSRPPSSSYPPAPKWNDRATSSRSSPKDRDSDTSSYPPRDRDPRGKPRQLSRWEADDEKLAQSKIPRYLRREAAHIAEDMDFSSPPPPRNGPEASGSKSRFRSRHLTEESRVEIRNPSGKIVLLEPHVLSARLKKSCEAGHIEEAVSMLKRSPLDAQNPPVWNTLIWECLKAKRFQLAYQLYIDVRVDSV